MGNVLCTLFWNLKFYQKKKKNAHYMRINAGKFSSFKHKRYKNKFLVQPLANKICRNEYTFHCLYAFIIDSPNFILQSTKMREEDPPKVITSKMNADKSSWFKCQWTKKYITTQNHGFCRMFTNSGKATLSNSQ